MDKKRYQTFVSSTYFDLQEERSKVMQTLMKLDCIPAGMELFPAMDEEQLSFIKRIIDDCDYYLVIVGGRYGSLSPDGVSYTEKEYEYAVSRQLPVVALIHEKPEDLPLKLSETDSEAVRRLEAFRQRLRTGRLVEFWTHADELAGKVALSMVHTMKAFPAAGWIRADKVPREQLLEEVADLRRKNDKLESELRGLKGASIPEIPDLAGLDETVRLFGEYQVHQRGFAPRKQDWSMTITWRALFVGLAPFLMEYTNETTVRSHVSKLSRKDYSADVNEQIFQTVRLQLMATRLVRVSHLDTHNGGKAWFWKLTTAGHELMFQERLVRKASDS